MTNQIDLFGMKIEIKEKETQCPYCKNAFKIVDTRHLLHCSAYRKTLPAKKEARLDFIDSILLNTSLYLPKDVSQITLPNGKKLDFIFVDGRFCGFLFQVSDAINEKYDATRMRYNRLCKIELAPNIKGITYQKKITTDRLIRDFKTELPVRSFKKAKSLVLLREDDMVFLMSKSTTSKESDLITKYLIDYFFKAKEWICDLIYKLGKCNNREFLFFCAWLRLGYALEEIEPQYWYRLPNTTRRVDFRLKDGEILVEIDAEDIKIHSPKRDKTTDRWFFSKGKILIRFLNSEIDREPLKCVRETINIAKENGIYITHQILPTFIKGFLGNTQNDSVQNGRKRK